MPLPSKQSLARLLARYPFYWTMPPGGLRTGAALLYHGEHSSAERVDRLVRSLSGLPTGRLPVAVVAARAAFRVGQDELLASALDTLEDRFPEAAQPLLLRADLDTYHGQYEAALAHAERARLLHPASGAATARVVRLGYRVLDQATADQAAVTAIGRFPRTSEVLWAICKACDSPQQYARLRAAWDERVREETDLLHGVRPLALAAARAGEVESARQLYRDAIEVIARTKTTPPRVSETRLGGHGAWQAIVDLNEAMTIAQVPFFFAAGTALGLVREGRPLSADSDIDIGVFETDWDRDALIKVFTDHPRFDLDLHPQTQKVSLRHRGGSPVDVFRFYREGDRVWHDGVFVRWHNTPFTVAHREIREQRLPLPVNAENYLTENYGDWRVPDPAFDAFTDDAPNVTITWPEYQRLHFLRRAYKRLAAGDAATASRELARAGEASLPSRDRAGAAT